MRLFPLGITMLESQDLLRENSLDPVVYRNFLVKLGPHLDSLLAVYSEDLSHYERHARTNEGKKPNFVNPFSSAFFLRASPEDRALKRVQNYWQRLPKNVSEEYPLLSQLEPMHFIDMNRALIMGAEKIAGLSYRQQSFLNNYARRNSIFSIPFNIQAKKMRTRHAGGHYVVSLSLPLPPEEAREEKSSTDIHAFVKDFNTLEQKEREERIHLFAEHAGCLGPRILFSYKKFLIYEYGEEEHSPLSAVREAVRRQHG